MKIVISPRYGGYGLSHTAIMAVYERKGITVYPIVCSWEPGNDKTIYRNYYGDKLSFADYVKYSRSPLGSGELDIISDDFERTDPDLIAVVEELGSELCSTEYSEIRIIEIPDDVEWEIAEYDGYEHVEEKHRRWHWEG